MTARDPDPIAATRCPQCTSSDQVTATNDYELQRTGKRFYCWTDDLFFDGTASEADRYTARRIADAAERGHIGGQS